MSDAGAAFVARGRTSEIETGSVFTPKFDGDGLIPAIVSDCASGEVLMFAFMNAEALALTLSTGTAHFWSRSRGKLWRKGQESGNTLAVVEMRTDCDQDVVWLRVEVAGNGVACHTGATSCFYRQILPSPTPAGARLAPTGGETSKSKK
jgi:phosphoribosyl-AMP cyclohydrolase